MNRWESKARLPSSLVDQSFSDISAIAIARITVVCVQL